MNYFDFKIVFIGCNFIFELQKDSQLCLLSVSHSRCGWMMRVSGILPIFFTNKIRGKYFNLTLLGAFSPAVFAAGFRLIMVEGCEAKP